MDYIARVLGLSSLEDRRKHQISRQKELDQQVSQFVDECPQTVARYYLHQREMSRRQQMRIIDSSITGKLSTLKAELDQNDVYYDQLEKALSSKCLCQKLPSLMKEVPPPKDPPGGKPPIAPLGALLERVNKPEMATQ